MVLLQAVRQPLHSARHVAHFSLELKNVLLGQSGYAQAMTTDAFPIRPGARIRCTSATCRPTWPGAGTAQLDQPQRPVAARHQSWPVRHQPANRGDVADQQPEQPGGGQALLRDRRQEPAGRPRPPGQGPGEQRRDAEPGGHMDALRGGQEPGHHRGRRGVPQRRAGTDPVPADHRVGARTPAAGGAAADQQVLRLRPVPGQEPGALLPAQRRADLHRQLAQPDQVAARMGPDHLYRGAQGGHRGSPVDHRQQGPQPPRRLLRRDHHRDPGRLLTSPAARRRSTPSPNWSACSTSN